MLDLNLIMPVKKVSSKFVLCNTKAVSRTKSLIESVNSCSFLRICINYLYRKICIFLTGTTVGLQIKTLCIQHGGTGGDLSFTFCNSDQCCSTGGIQPTNGRPGGSNLYAVDCNMPDIFGSSQIGDCKDFVFGSESIITGNVTLSNNDGFRGEWVKVRSSDGSFLQCTIDGWIDGDNTIPNENDVPKYHVFSCSYQSKHNMGYVSQGKVCKVILL